MGNSSDNSSSNDKQMNDSSEGSSDGSSNHEEENGEESEHSEPDEIDDDKGHDEAEAIVVGEHIEHFFGQPFDNESNGSTTTTSSCMLTTITRAFNPSSEADVARSLKLDAMVTFRRRVQEEREHQSRKQRKRERAEQQRDEESGQLGLGEPLKSEVRIGISSQFIIGRCGDSTERVLFYRCDPLELPVCSL